MSLVKGLFRDYGDFKVDIPQWEIPDDGISALIGPSGSGKTSVFRLLIGLEACPSLSWVFRGQDLAKLPISQRTLGVVFQTLELFPHMSAVENLIFAQRARKIPESEGIRYREELLEVLKLNHCKDQTAATLSGGEKQRVALARALVGHPRFLFLDEPFSAIDEDLRAEARGLVLRCVQHFKIPTLIITHDGRDVQALGARQFRIMNGKLL